MHQPFTIKLDYYKGNKHLHNYMFDFLIMQHTGQMWFHVETHHQKAPSAVVFNALHTDQNVEDRFSSIRKKKA